MRDSEFDFIRHILSGRSRSHRGTDNRQQVSARLGQRLRATNLRSLTDYCPLLKQPGTERELGQLIEALSPNKTLFFREPAHFDFLRTTAVPELIERAQAARCSTLRFWSAACSSGEEAYSLAMTLAESTGSMPWHIEASDVSRRILARAAAAIYDREAIGRLPAETVRAHFQRGFGAQDGQFRVKPELRNRVSFHHLNLFEGEPPFTDLFHVIFCRNVTTAFKHDRREELVDRLARWLAPGGYLMVGDSESLMPLRQGLQRIRHAIYRKPGASPV